MPNDNEKLTRFEKAVFAEVNAKTIAILSEADSSNKAILDKAEKEAKVQFAKQSQTEIEEAEAHFAQAVSKEKLNSKQQILLKRKERIETLFQKAGETLLDFVQSEDYIGYIRQILEKLDLKDSKILARESDCKMVKTLAPNCDVEPDLTNLLGGIIVVNPSENLYVDETFASKLEAKKADFYSDSSIRMDIL